MHVRSKSPIQQTRAIFTGNVKILNESSIGQATATCKLSPNPSRVLPLVRTLNRYIQCRWLSIYYMELFILCSISVNDRCKDTNLI